jgi:hypothetical protein
MEMVNLWLKHVLSKFDEFELYVSLLTTCMKGNLNAHPLLKRGEQPGLDHLVAVLGRETSLASLT